jgi:hypothetical protein
MTGCRGFCVQSRNEKFFGADGLFEMSPGILLECVFFHWNMNPVWIRVADSNRSGRMNIEHIEGVENYEGGGTKRGT